MDQIKMAISSMISISDSEFQGLLETCSVREFKRREIMSAACRVCNEIFFINKGITRNLITDNDGAEHTTHFSLENQFIADYASFLMRSPASYSIQALEDTQVIVIPRTAIEWGYKNLKEGQKLGRLIAEFYFIYLDDRVKSLYKRVPTERYKHIAEIFPNIHNRVPQHMIASYLGITSIHLSRLKKAAKLKT